MKSINFSVKAGRFAFPILFLFFFSCSKDVDDASTIGTSPSPTSDTTPSTDQLLKPYSGTWKGTFKKSNITQGDGNSCSLDPESISVTQDWQVRADSTISINESLYDSGRYPSKHSWSGRIYKKDSISITTSRVSICGDNSTNLTLHIQGKILRVGNSLTLTSYVNYQKCNCQYVYTYTLSKR